MNEQTIVCVRADDCELVAVGSARNECSKCQSSVLIAPSGQRCLRDNPATVIVCTRCFLPPPGAKAQLAASVEELRAEAATAQPNTWRNRN